MKTAIYLRVGASRSASAGFSRTDLFALLCTASLLVLLLFTSGASSATRSRLAVCLNNHKQLSRAWLGYAEDNGGKLVGNLDGGNVSILSNSNLTWVLGWLDFSTRNGENTNTLFLTKYSPLAPYLGHSSAPFQCPADFSKSEARSNLRHVRSVSMNGYLGSQFSWTSGYRLYRSTSDVTDPAPSRTFVFIDEREDSINGGMFQMDMSGYDPQNPSAYRLVDFPADWHDRSANLSFADGHAETWRWRDPRTRPGHKSGQSLSLAVSSPNNVDVARLHEVTSRRIK